MPVNKQDKLLVSCPHCGHQQPEPRAAYSTVCKSCGRHYHVQEAAKPIRKTAPAGPEQKRITCFECATEMQVALSAQSAMCKRCGAYIDLRDYHITSVVSKNFKTRGHFVIEPKGNVYNTETLVEDAVIKGKFLGKLVALHSLTVFSTAEIKGTFKTAQFIVPPTNHFRWHEPLKVGSADIAGELVAHLEAEGTIILRATARMFGGLVAKNLVVEAGAVVVGNARIGNPGASPK